MVSEWLQLRNSEVMEVLQALVAKSQLAISLCCPHLSECAAILPESLLIATGSVSSSLEHLMLR